MVKCRDSEKLHIRLKKIAGQINGIDRMIDEDFPCEEILMQINASTSALQKVGQIVLEGHLNNCVVERIETEDKDRIIKDLTKAIDYYSRI